MKVMVLVKASKDSESGKMPSELAFREMMNFNEELVKAGVMLAGEGLHPTSRGARVRFPQKQVIDGPFTESKEVVGGYALVEASSYDEALVLATRFMDLHRIHWPQFEGECEVRPLEANEPQ